MRERLQHRALDVKLFSLPWLKERTMRSKSASKAPQERSKGVPGLVALNQRRETDNPQEFLAATILAIEAPRPDVRRRLFADPTAAQQSVEEEDGGCIYRPRWFGLTWIVFVGCARKRCEALFGPCSETAVEEGMFTRLVTSSLCAGMGA